MNPDQIVRSLSWHPTGVPVLVGYLAQADVEWFMGQRQDGYRYDFPVLDLFIGPTSAGRWVGLSGDREHVFEHPYWELGERVDCASSEEAAWAISLCAFVRAAGYESNSWASNTIVTALARATGTNPDIWPGIHDMIMGCCDAAGVVDAIVEVAREGKRHDETQ